MKIRMSINDNNAPVTAGRVKTLQNHSDLLLENSLYVHEEHKKNCCLF